MLERFLAPRYHGDGSITAMHAACDTFLLLMVPILELFVGLAVPQGESALTPARSETKSVPRQVLAPDGPIGIAEYIEEHDLYLLYVDLTRGIISLPILLPILSDLCGQN
jgi:hypothetical protein